MDICFPLWSAEQGFPEVGEQSSVVFACDVPSGVHCFGDRPLISDWQIQDVDCSCIVCIIRLQKVYFLVNKPSTYAEANNNEMFHIISSVIYCLLLLFYLTL